MAGKPKEKVKESRKEAYDPWRVLEHPHLAEKSMGLVEAENKLVFIVKKRADKERVKEAVEMGFGVKVD